jgi:hypothetical protein
MADLIVVDPRYAIAWKRGSHDELIIATNGLTFSVAADDAITDLLELLNSGKPVTVAQLVERYARDATHAEAILQVFMSLHRFRAFRTINHKLLGDSA